MAEWINHPGKNTSNNSATMVRQDVADGAALVTPVSRTQRGTTAQRDTYFSVSGDAGRTAQHGDTWANTTLGYEETYDGSTSSWVPSVKKTDGVAHVATEVHAAVEIHHGDVNEYLIPVASFYVLDAERLGIQMEVEDNALDQFEVRYQYFENGEFVTRASAALDWTTPNAPILAASGSFLTASVGSGHWMHLDVSGVYAVQLWAASGNASGSKLTFTGSAQ